jgi:8-oxo-dGTP pyrophosphatase MutT (NUDIX family)
MTTVTTPSARPLLDLDPDRPAARPTDAATLVLIRDTAAGLEVFCVQRNAKSGFMGGAIVFPGGRVEEGDHGHEWDGLVLPADARVDALADGALSRALAIAACRECLEEAAILPVDGPLSQADVLALREVLQSDPAALRRALSTRGLRLNLPAMVPFARWITPVAERRRFDARFFMLRAPAGQTGVHDAHETTQSFWATPDDVIARWQRSEIQLAPPTHHTLWTLSRAESVDAALAGASVRPLKAIEPHLIQYDGTRALTLPGDAEHPQSERLTDGATRYVLRQDHWRPE